MIAASASFGQKMNQFIRISCLALQQLLLACAFHDRALRFRYLWWLH
jgi:hypothetical protein